MDRENLQSFIRNAERDLASARSGLLIAAQSSDASDLAIPRRDLARLHAEATANGLTDVAQSSADCLLALDSIADRPTPDRIQIYSALDMLAAAEAAVWKIPLKSDTFLEDVSGFIEASFDHLIPHEEAALYLPTDDEAFEIDDETLEIFRSEAEELLANINASLATLINSPNDQNGLWEIRRNAHTFKGAAGIVGLTEASNIAHRIEDLLDKIVELKLAASPKVLDFISKSCERLDAISASRIIDEGAELESEYLTAMESLAFQSEPEAKISEVGPHSGKDQASSERPTTTPIVRVSLDRLDELLGLSRALQLYRTSLVEKFAQFGLELGVDEEKLTKLGEILDSQSNLTDELHSKLLRIRMVRFGTLETRLSRAVNVTCIDEGKKASVNIENPDVEIDTQIIDALIEPLLHLLKNAVVHGIETPETRRLIGKPEAGKIIIGIEADEEALVLSVADDGGGISIPKLKEKAIANGIIDHETAEQLKDRDALKLIFDRGLTTADKIDLNAGRGVGMSIVQESVESRGGSVLIESELRRGTTFTILMPLSSTKPEEPNVNLEISEPQERLAPLVLVVDDSASIRRHAVKLIEKAGLRVITANNGADALELLLDGTFEPNLILSDVEMPHIDGWDFLEYVKTDDNFGHVPVVIVSSLDAELHREKALGLGASDYLNKPFSEEHLSNLLENLGIAIAA